MSQLYTGCPTLQNTTLIYETVVLIRLFCISWNCNLISETNKKYWNRKMALYLHFTARDSKDKKYLSIQESAFRINLVPTLVNSAQSSLNDRMFECASVRMIECSNDRVFECSNGSNDRVFEWSSVRMIECSNEWVFNWTSVQMIECSNERLYERSSARIID